MAEINKRRSNKQRSPDDNEIAHEVLDFFDTPYLTPSATRLMREISGNRGVITEESM